LFSQLARKPLIIELTIEQIQLPRIVVVRKTKFRDHAAWCPVPIRKLGQSPTVLKQRPR